MNKMFGLVFFAVTVCLVHRVDCCDEVVKEEFIFSPRPGAQHTGGRNFVLTCGSVDIVRVSFTLPFRVNFTLTELVVEYETDVGSYIKKSKIKLMNSDSAPVVDNMDDGLDTLTYSPTEVTNKVVVQLKCPDATDDEGICRFRIVTMNGCLA